MKNIFIKNKNQKGYAILFTVVIVSAISVITAGISNAAYKQLILSSLAKDSQSAFYQADTAGDCALYIDRVFWTTPAPNITTVISPWSCGGSSSSLTVTPRNPVSTGYDISPVDQNSLNPCFRINVAKDIITTLGTTKTTIQAKGYNICNKNNLRTVEREIEINYEE